MSAFHTLELECPCGHKFTHQVARGINVQRSPKFRKEILDGTFHRVSCPVCRKNRIVEAAFSYVDPKAKLFIQVKPRKNYFNWREASQVLEKKVNRLPRKNKVTGAKLRVVFGLAELREKLLCDDAKFDDRLLELMKVILLYEHPFLMRRPRLQFVLTSVTADSFVFRASHVHDKRHYEIAVPKAQVNRFKATETAIRSRMKSAMNGNNMFDAKNGHFMSYLRFMPQTDAMASLAKYAKDVRASKHVPMTSKDFRLMLKKLPRASQLSWSAKKDLKDLQLYAKKKFPALQAALWEVRFGKEMEAEFGSNDSNNDIDTLWRVFEDLPDNHIEGNNRITEIQLTDGGGGTYDPTDGEIDIGVDELLHRASFEDTVRHEVGHGVHEAQHKKIQPWLEQRFGWKIFPGTFAGMDKWVSEMKGWGTATKAEKKLVYECFRQAFDGSSEWSRGEVKNVKKDHIWNRKNFAPRKAYEKSQDDWFNTCLLWHNDGKRAFFLNYYYDTFCMVNVDTLKLIDKMPSRYAAMSDHEFFAELYALYFDDKDKRRRFIPKDVQKWLKEL